MTKEELARKLKELPDSVTEHLYDDSVGEANGRIIDENSLDEAHQQALYDLIDELIVRAVPIENTQAEVEKRFGFDKVKSQKLSLDIAGYRLLLLDKWLGDVSGYIRSLGGNITAYPTVRVQLVTRTPDEAASDLVNSVASADWEPHHRNRLKDIAESYYRGVRTEPQVLDILTRPDKIGGMEMKPEEAMSAIQEMKEEARATLIGEKKVEPPADSQDGALAPPTAVAKTITSDSFSEADAAEVQKHADGLLSTKAAEASAMTAEKIKASVEQIYAAAALNIPDEKLQERLKTVIGGRLRDVRDALETLETLVQPKELGGLSLSQDDARRVLKLVDDSLRAVRAAHQQQVEDEKAKWLETEAQKKHTANEAAKTENVTQLDTLYQNIVAKSPKAQNAQAKATPPPALVAIPKPQAPNPNPPAPLTPAEKLVPANLPIIEAMPSVKPVVAPPPPPPVATAIPKPVTLVRPAPQIAASPSVRPIMQDVKPMGGGAGMHLTGPAEELRTTTVLDFRRLSKDPVVAAQKVIDKVDLLHQQAYEKRTEGIAAWNESEVYRTYISMMKEALDGKPMPQVISDRTAAKQPFLSSEEMKAVADLSRKLRY